MRIQYVSDLHLEFPDNTRWIAEHPLEVCGEVLLVAGDSGYVNMPDYAHHPFWRWASEHYKQVIIALGNHEFYQFADLADFPDGLEGEVYPNVHYYYNSVVSIGDVDIIVSTLWARISPENMYYTEHGVSDFYRIMYHGHRLSAPDFNAEHERCLSFLKNAVENSHAKTKIVLTHHVPTELCVAPEFRGSLINGAFTVELGNYIANADIDYWVYGHSHRNIEAEIAGTKIISNQLGYISHGEYLKNGFTPGKFFEV